MRQVRVLLVLVCALTLAVSTRASAQSPWPCPQSITPADLGYNGVINYRSYQWNVVSLNRISTFLDLTYLWYNGTYSTNPIEPVDMTGYYIWMGARINTRCQRVSWINPATGTEVGLVVVQETSKSGTVAERDRFACNGGGGGWASASYDPYGETDCENGEEGGVDWETGEPNGGDNDCPTGSTALVEYVCIDFWVNGAGWVEYDCGWATVCT